MRTVLLAMLAAASLTTPLLTGAQTAGCGNSNVELAPVDNDPAAYIWIDPAPANSAGPLTLLVGMASHVADGVRAQIDGSTLDLMLTTRDVSGFNEDPWPPATCSAVTLESLTSGTYAINLYLVDAGFPDSTRTLVATGSLDVTQGSAGGAPSANVPITTGFTGAWYDPSQSGHGIFLEVLPNSQLLAWWFAFDPNGQQAWFGGVGPINGNNTAVINALQTEGGRWIPNFDPSATVQAPWGMLTFSFTDCNHGRVDFTSVDQYTFGVSAGHMDLTRLTQPAGLACP